MQWGPEADAKMFMHVLKIHSVKIDYAALALAMGNDVTPKALTHRIAKLRSMADDASSSTSTTTTSAGHSLPQPTKRNATKPRAARAMTPGPGRKKAAATENNVNEDDDEEDVKKVVNGAGVKRTATGAVKGGVSKKKSPLQNVVVAGATDAEMEMDEEGEDVKSEGAVNKKVKTAAAGGEGNKEYA